MSHRAALFLISPTHLMDGRRFCVFVPLRDAWRWAEQMSREWPDWTVESTGIVSVLPDVRIIQVVDGRSHV